MLRILGIGALLLLIYTAYALLNPHSIAQWKWAAAVDAFEAERFDEATDYAQQALEWAPEDPEFRVNYAEMLVRLDQVEEARVQIDAAIVMKPDDPLVYAALSMLLARMGQHDGSLMLSNKVVEMAESDRTMHLHRALNHRAYMIALAAADDYSGATPDLIQAGLDDINKAIDRFGPDPSYLDTRGYLRLFADDRDGALEDLNLAIEKFEAVNQRLLEEMDQDQIENPPRHIAARAQYIRNSMAALYGHRAEVYEALGKQDLAQKDFARAEKFGLNRKEGIW